MSRIITQAAILTAWAETQHQQGKSVGFVPTMGALHEGHLSLVTLAKKHADHIVLSLFVNPTQFNDPKDFEKYPRTEEDDCRMAFAAGVDVVFLPSVEEVYPPGDGRTERTLRCAPTLIQHLCGPTRPGHFEGVVQVVSRLFEIVKPDCAVFGEKDYQQLAVIRQMVKEQKSPVNIIGAPIIRDPDGLAMSSRNRRLSSEGRREALRISRGLAAARKLFESGEKDPRKLLATCRHELGNLKIDYVELVETTTLQPVTNITRPVLLAVAAFVEDVRLIDNVMLEC